MNTPPRILNGILSVTLPLLFVLAASAQYSEPPAQPAEIEAAYTIAIDKRAAAIVEALKLSDSGKAARVTEVLTNQYRSLRARDEAIDAKIKAQAKEGAKIERASLFPSMSAPLHEKFLSRLATDLTPEQIETVKDKMTYGKVKVTYDAYCAIVPNLTEKEKERILEELKGARDEAIDGGSADEKSAIFQKHKDKINEYLTTQGHDVAKAYADWNAKQALAQKKDESKGSQQTK